MKLSVFAVFLLGAGMVAAFPVCGASGLFDQGRVMVENTRLRDAGEMLRQWLSTHPEGQEARFLLARILAWQEKHTEALEQYNHLLENDPENGDYVSGRAMLALPESQNPPGRPFSVFTKNIYVMDA